MAVINFTQEGPTRSFEYQEGQLCLNFIINRKQQEFSCFWTPKINPYSALDLLITFGFLPPEPIPGLIKTRATSYRTSGVEPTFDKILALDPGNVNYVQLGPDHNCLIIKLSPTGVGYCFGVKGEFNQLGFLGTALTLTAPAPLISQYSAMYSRLR